MQLNLTGFGVLLFVKGHYCTIRLELASYWIIATSPPITFRPRIVEKQLEINKVRLVMANRRLFGAVNSKCLNDSFSSISGGRGGGGAFFGPKKQAGAGMF